LRKDSGVGSKKGIGDEHKGERRNEKIDNEFCFRNIHILRIISFFLLFLAPQTGRVRICFTHK